MRKPKADRRFESPAHASASLLDQLLLDQASRFLAVAGIDVSKAKLDIAILPSGEQFTSSNNRQGIGELIQRLRPLAPSRVVLEATGKLEQLALSELAAAGLAVAVVNPAQV